jgi:Mn-containing catalase
MVEHPVARALTGYLLVRGGLHQVSYARALERLPGANLMKLFPTSRIPIEEIPESARCCAAASNGQRHGATAGLSDG